uniref:hypothetical protein n=1 Tax=Pectobacterium carotovorum TaxID=554 RepID=UPI001D144903|nr:hypothetical protein [Pectobacterium carotovorum]
MNLVIIFFVSIAHAFFWGRLEVRRRTIILTPSIGWLCAVIVIFAPSLIWTSEH